MKSWRKWLAALFVIALAAYFFHPLAGGALRAGTGLVAGIIDAAAYLFTIVVLPLGALWLLFFIYSLFLRPWLRAWRINRIRNARALQEALDRGRSRDT
jgi:hypothetical protein